MIDQSQLSTGMIQSQIGSYEAHQVSKRIQPLGCNQLFKKTDLRSKLDNSQFTLTTTIDLPSTLLEMTRPVDPGYGMLISNLDLRSVLLNN